MIDVRQPLELPAGGSRSYFSLRQFERSGGGWEEFQRQHRRELNASPDAGALILEQSRHGAVDLFDSAHDALHRGALVLSRYLTEHTTGAQVPRDAGGRALRRGAHAVHRQAG